jgi:hypothetical protein
VLRPQIEPHFFVYELQRVAFAIVELDLVTPARTISSKNSFKRAQAATRLQAYHAEKYFAPANTA